MYHAVYPLSAWGQHPMPSALSAWGLCIMPSALFQLGASVPCCLPSFSLGPVYSILVSFLEDLCVFFISFMPYFSEEKESLELVSLVTAKTVL